MTTKTIFERVYTDESMPDIGEDVFHALDESDLPVDQWGFIKGEFKVTITWTDKVVPSDEE